MWVGSVCIWTWSEEGAPCGDRKEREEEGEMDFFFDSVRAS
jgi:hypothetical protein